MKWIIRSQHAQNNSQLTEGIVVVIPNWGKSSMEIGLIWEGFQVINLDLDIQGWKGQEDGRKEDGDLAGKGISMSRRNGNRF